MCPGCSGVQAPNIGPTVEVGPGRQREYPVSARGEELEVLRLQRLELAGFPAPGSDAERQALDRQRELREIEREDEEEYAARERFYKKHRDDPTAVYKPKRRRNRGRPAMGLRGVFYMPRTDGRVIVHADPITKGR